MIAWRVGKVRHDLLDPTGARLHGARWNAPGRGVLYAADSFAGALLEILVHSSRPRTLPGPHHALRLVIPDDLLEQVEDPPEGWDAPASPVARELGTRWFDGRRSTALAVPSLPARPVGRVLLLNPAHPDWTRVEVGSPFGVPWDERLFR